MKLKELNALYEGLVNLSTRMLTITESFKMAKLINQIKADAENFVKLKNELLEKHGELIDGEEGKYNLKGEGLKKYTKELTDLEDIEVAVDEVKIRLPKISMFSTQELLPILDFIEIEE